MPRFRHRRVRLIALALLLTAAAAWVLAHEGHAPLPSKGATVDRDRGRIQLSAESRAALDVGTAAVEARSLPGHVLAYATLTAPPRAHAFASSRLGGRVIAVHARAGQRVEAGQVLAEVRSLELESMRLEARTARNDVRRAEQMNEMLRQAGEARPRQERLDAEAQLQQYRNALEIARLKWTALGLADRDFTVALDGDSTAPPLPVRSPLGGILIHADLPIGKVVEPGEHLFEVVNSAKVWAKIGVLERDLGQVTEGQEVELRLTAFPGEVFRSKLRGAPVFLDPETHLATAWAEFTNSTDTEPRLVPGLSGQARLMLPGPAGVRVVPTTALIHDGVEHYVFVEESAAASASEYVRRNVRVVSRAPDWAQLRAADLLPGDRVVTRGAHELAGFFEPTVLRLSPEAQQTIGLKVEPLKAQAIDDIVTVGGEVDYSPDRRTVASAQLGGSLRHIHVDIGASVKAGQVLAEVVGLELHNVQLDLLKEHLTFTLLDRQYEELKKLGPAVPRRRLLEVEGEWSAARNRRDSLRRRLEVIGLSATQIADLLERRRVVEAAPVRAPIDGVVVHFDRVLGQVIKAEEPLFEVHDASRPLVRGYVPEADLARVRAGQTARVRLIGDPGTVHAGKVVRSAGVLSGAEQARSIWIELNHRPAERPRHGQMARLTIAVQLGSPVRAVPLEAVVRDGTLAYVFEQMPNGAFERREVETGRADDRFVEIVRGVKPGCLVAVAGTADLWTAYHAVR